MKTLIYQVAVGPPSSLYQSCQASVSRYCKKYNIDHHVQTEPLLRIRPLNSHRSTEAVERLGYLPIFEKENAFAYLDQYDAVCILDSDIYCRDHAPNIFLEIGNHDFAAVIERDIPANARHQRKLRKYSQSQYGPLTQEADFRWDQHGAGFYNMGLMLMNRSINRYISPDTPEQFLRRPEFQRFVDGHGAWRWSTDQTLLNYWVRTSGMTVRDLDWRWNALYGVVPDPDIKQSWFVHFFLAVHHVGDRDIDLLVRDIES